MSVSFVILNKQKIEITLEEYKKLRDICEEYNRLLGEYQLLSYVYNHQFSQVEEIEETSKKEKTRTIGFKQS